jgi:hypothetical protein
MPVKKKVLENRCPLKSRSDHGHRRPATISITGLQHITHQIEGIGYKTLSCISLCAEIAPRRDGGFAISVVSADGVLGFYNRELAWKPYPRCI